jgi:hypothetical protein
MIANSLLAATTVSVALAFFLMQECQFLIPYRTLLVAKYGGYLAAFAAALFLNLFAAFYVLSRKLFLKDTGQKLAHLEKQLRAGDTVSEELTRRLREEDRGPRY